MLTLRAAARGAVSGAAGAGGAAWADGGGVTTHHALSWRPASSTSFASCDCQSQCVTRGSDLDLDVVGVAARRRRRCATCRAASARAGAASRGRSSTTKIRAHSQSRSADLVGAVAHAVDDGRARLALEAHDAVEESVFMHSKKTPSASSFSPGAPLAPRSAASASTCHLEGSAAVSSADRRRSAGGDRRKRRVGQAEGAQASIATTSYELNSCHHVICAETHLRCAASTESWHDQSSMRWRARRS